MGAWRAPLVLGASAVLLVTGYALFAPSSIDPLPAASSLPAAGSLDRGSPAGDPTAQARPSGDGRLAKSLVGTVPDGALVTDGSGAFIATPDALDFFDYYLSTLGEQSLAQIVATIEDEIRNRLDPPDAALELLNQYLAYREQVRELVEAEGLDALPLHRRLQRLREIRRGAFGPDLAERLFAEDEQRAREAIAWREISLDPDLDPEARAEQLAAFELRLPEAELERRTRTTLAKRTLEREAELREQGSSQGEINAWREQEFGEAAATRLAELDRTRAEWNARVAHYRDEAARLEEVEFADASEAAVALEALRARLFEGPELLRIRALDANLARATR